MTARVEQVIYQRVEIIKIFQSWIWVDLFGLKLQEDTVLILDLETLVFFWWVQICEAEAFLANHSTLQAKIHSKCLDLG